MSPGTLSTVGRALSLTGYTMLVHDITLHTNCCLIQVIFVRADQTWTIAQGLTI